MDQIRNFSIIAHIDHGKTTLTDRFLATTGTVSALDYKDRIMDSNPIERERGITIKLAPVRMDYKGYIFNLIDTPGHVDFGYEVSRSLAACEGVLLLVDASQGIQAQTLTNFEKAKALNLKIIPVLNKMDLPSVNKEEVMLECMETFGVEEDEILSVSAKTGQGVEELLDAIIDRIPAPKPSQSDKLRGMVLTSKFDQHKGAIVYVRVIDGVLKQEKLTMFATGESFLPNEVGFFTPKMTPTKELKAGEVGYVATGLKDVSNLKVGDTITQFKNRDDIKPLEGFKLPTPMVYMEIYPIDGDEFTLLQDAMEKLALHDSSLVYAGTHSTALGNGLRVGFLGILHAEIVLERLKREFSLDLIATAPTVTYKITDNNGKEIEIHTPSEMPDPTFIKMTKEPMTNSVIFTPERYYGAIMQMIRDRRGELKEVKNVGVRMRVKASIPLAEIIIDFHDTLKSLTSGFASLEYELSGYKEVDAVKVSILLNKEPVDALSLITVQEKAEQEGKRLVKKLKEVVPRQMFELPIQAAIGGKIIARETIKAFRKDVTAKLYGGDVTRRQKLLKKQAKGKKRMKQFGRVELNQESFLAVLKR
ncbi:MAG: translation elongation factor 4 [Candidatus Pacebacteria bacterium]|nr:translation elongation factor 4 [Candidatus Paceibacterota bacterium]